MKHVKYEEMTAADVAGVEFWGEDGAERLTHRDINEAIEHMLDSIDNLPATIDVIGYERDNLDLREYTATAVLESLDEEYGDPDGCRARPWPELTQAAEAFVAELRRGYEVWRCSEVIRVTVQVRPWVEAHCPEWLEASP